MASRKYEAEQARKEQERVVKQVESRGGRASQSDHTKLAELRTNERDLKGK